MAVINDDNLLKWRLKRNTLREDIHYMCVYACDYEDDIYSLIHHLI